MQGRGRDMREIGIRMGEDGAKFSVELPSLLHVY
jgi:hypothetical protein